MAVCVLCDICSLLFEWSVVVPKMNKGLSAPKYNELICHVEQLTKVVEMSEREKSDWDVRSTSSKNSGASLSTPVVSYFCVVPDLNKSVYAFIGHESSHQAEDWICSVEDLAELNNWPFYCTLQLFWSKLQNAVCD